MKLHEMDLTKKIRLSNWDSHQYIECNDNCSLFFNQETQSFGLSPYHIKSDDWEYFEEPKKKNKKWLWRYKDTSCWLVDYQYMDDVQMVSKGRVTDRNYEKLLWSEIEVEE